MKEIVNDICPREETDGEEMASKRSKPSSLSAVTQALKVAKKWVGRYQEYITTVGTQYKID